MFLLLVLANIKVYMINDDKNIYFLFMALCLLAKIRVYMINDIRIIFYRCYG